MDNFADMIKQLEKFQSNNLAERIFNLEALFSGASKIKSNELCMNSGIDEKFLQNLFKIKSIAGQINVIIHTVGILISLPYILRQNEIVTDLSLGADNSGRDFDLETNMQIAEFKFIQWQGGPETIRQNKTFEAFLHLAESNSTKDKFLYLLGEKYPIKFFNSRRKITSVLSRNNRLLTNFVNTYDEKYERVIDYYKNKKKQVKIIDLCKIVPEIGNILNNNVL